MTENKRFKSDRGTFWDNDKRLNMDETVELLNALHEENQDLKIMLNQCQDQRNEFHRGARENANRVGKLEKENEQLEEDNKKLSAVIVEICDGLEDTLKRYGIIGADND